MMIFHQPSDFPEMESWFPFKKGYLLGGPGRGGVAIISPPGYFSFQHVCKIFWNLWTQKHLNSHLQIWFLHILIIFSHAYINCDISLTGKIEGLHKNQLPPFKQKTPPFGGLTFFHLEVTISSQIPIGAVWIFGFVFPAPESGDFVLAPVSSRFLAPEGSGCPRSLFSLNMRWWSKACWTICEWHGNLPKANGSLVVELSIWPFKIP